MLPIVLSSTSEYRRLLLKKLGLPFTCVSPNIDESPLENESPKQLVMRLSQAKASALQCECSSHLIIASDQICVLDGKITGKPHNFENALLQLKKASGKCITFYTGITLLNSKTNVVDTRCELFHVYFRDLSETEIIHYLNKEQPFNCAGSFKSEGLGITLFEKLDGKDPNTLIGLPLITLTEMLIRQGINPLTVCSQ
ncbi:Maf family protein [Xenorhabdus sp. PR6a]|uniref:Maf family protein n=1 Tax=Xenorhabdus sp. PR6a TaxID=3025877 RepID=UPI00235913D1|nr:nucleoside triphosphate pyrophosphatase [Xenorhabdus sp. PR6a]MDC9581560.1 Maf family protein [Xenorhabdus sp. PR6a]